MKNKDFTQNDLLNLLIKKATGFYYTEEQYEYEKTQNKSNSIKINENLSDNLKNNDRVATQLNFIDDKIEVSNEIKTDTKNLTLVKKKVATHYISPDMLAIKILLEIYGKKIGDENVDDLSNEELLKLKETLIGELLDEENNNFRKN